jgi:glycosyltransferase involved in cell wall biosynthesis
MATLERRPGSSPRVRPIEAGPAERPGWAPAGQRPVRLLYLVSHPIQYQAPLLALLARQPWLELEVAFLSDRSVRGHFDPGFGRELSWDVDLLTGYRHRFLEARFGAEGLGLLRPWSKGLRELIDPRRFDAVWLHGYAQVSLLEALLTARRAGLPVLLRGESLLHGRPRNGWRARLRALCLPQLLSQVSACLTIGSHNRDFYRAYGVPEERLFSMPYAVDNQRFERAAREAAPGRERLRAELGLRPGRPVVLFASKFQPKKRARDLLEAALALGDRGVELELLLIGDGEERGPLERRAAGRPGVRFLGFRNQTELPRFYDLADLFVLPSTYEPWGLVVNEAMASGTPVLASDRVGSARDLIEPGQNGWIFPAGDVAALTATLQTALSDREALARAGTLAAERMQRWNFDADVAGLRAALGSLGLAP